MTDAEIHPPNTDLRCRGEIRSDRLVPLKALTMPEERGVDLESIERGAHTPQYTIRTIGAATSAEKRAREQCAPRRSGCPTERLAAMPVA